MDEVLITTGQELENHSNPPLQRSTEAPILSSISRSSIAYVVVGVVLILVNTPIFINILRHRVLRNKKEYLLLAGLTGADMLVGWSTLIAGAYRLHLFSIGEASNQVTRWACITTPHFIFMIYSMIVETGMLLLISLDRLIAVLRPLHYFTFTRKYAIYMLGGCYVPSALYVALLLLYIRLLDNSSHGSTINAICFTQDVELFNSTIVYTRITFAFLGVIIYVVVWILFSKHRRSMRATFPTLENRLRRLQCHLSITVGICALLTFVFYILPTGLKFTDIDQRLWIPLYWLLNCCNAVVNVFVYSLRHEEIRRGLKLLLTGKELPIPAEQRLQNEYRMPFSVTGRAALFFIKAMSPTIPAHIIPRRPTASTSTCSTIISQ